MLERIELQDVEYGDCTVLVNRQQQILMVDCGSVSRYTRLGECPIGQRFQQIFQRYGNAAGRHFVLTHYHRDHLSGFLKQIETDPFYFDRVCLPVLPMHQDGTHPLLTLALFAHCFYVPQTDFSQINTQCLQLLPRLGGLLGAEKLCTLSSDGGFSFGKTVFQVLSPAPVTAYPEPLVQAAQSLLSLSAALAPAFSAAAQQVLTLYHRCQTLLSTASPASVSEKSRALAALADALGAAQALRHDCTVLRQPVQDVLQPEALRTLFSAVQNDLSLVFHDRRTRDSMGILLTGDVSPAVLDALSDRLYPEYFAIKLPHHGTESHYAPVLEQHPAPHLLISNGEYHAGSQTAAGYAQLDAICHCTNHSACPLYKTDAACCNRLRRCYEQPQSGHLALRCTAARGSRRTPCGIYVFTATGVQGCFCE